MGLSEKDQGDAPNIPIDLDSLHLLPTQKEQLRPALEKLLASTRDEGRKEGYALVVDWCKENILNRPSIDWDSALAVQNKNHLVLENPIKSALIEFLSGILDVSPLEIRTQDLRKIEEIADRHWALLPEIPGLGEMLATEYFRKQDSSPKP